MSESEAEKLYEYFSTVNEAREYLNTRIANIIQVVEKRKTILNCELDRLESKIKQEDTEGRGMLEKLVQYEQSTVDLFGDSEHLSEIQSKRKALESELARKKLKLEWIDLDLENKLESLGDVTYVLSSHVPVPHIYDDVIIKSKKSDRQISIGDKDSNEVPVRPQPTYENIKLVTEGGTKPTRSIPQVPSEPKNPVISLRSNSVPQYITVTQDDDPNESDIYDPIYETTCGSEENSPVDKDNGNTIEHYFYKDQSEFMLALPTTNLKRSTSFKTFFKVADSIKLDYSPENGSESCNYEIMDGVDMNASQDEDIWMANDYEVIDESTLVDIETARSILISKLPPYAESKRSSTLGRRKKLQAKFDLAQVAKCQKGSAIGRLDRPKAICISGKGHIFVAEKGNNRVQVFSGDGNYLLDFGEKSGPNKMVEPNGICIYREFVYVTLTNQHTVQQYTLQGGFLKQKGKRGIEEGMFKLPTGIDGDDSRGKIYICDTGNNRVQIFDSKIRLIKCLQTTCLLKPLGIKVIKDGDFIVLDRSPRCIHFFNSSGELLKEVINVSSHRQMVNPLYFTVSREGELILSDYSSDCIHIFTNEGKFLWTLGEAGKGKPLVEPRGVACDKNGMLVTVCNKDYEMLQIFKI